MSNDNIAKTQHLPISSIPRKAWNGVSSANLNFYEGLSL